MTNSRLGPAPEAGAGTTAGETVQHRRAAADVSCLSACADGRLQAIPLLAAVPDDVLTSAQGPRAEAHEPDCRPVTVVQTHRREE